MTAPAPNPTGYIPLFELAKGGMAKVEVVARVEGTFRRLFARKRPLPHLGEDPEFRNMFMNEARLAGSIRHPNVVPVLDVGEDAEGPYLVMEFIDGLPLSKLLRLVLRREEKVPIQIGLRVGRAVAGALRAVHRAVDPDGDPLGLVHRDLSPQNVLISWTGHVSVTDFGVAKARAHATETASGIIKGKMAYMAPEQLRYEPLTPKTDLFALGVVLFELFAGRRLYKARDGHDNARRILHEVPPDLGEERSVPPALVDLLFSLLAKDPAERPASAGEVAESLEAMLASVLAREPILSLEDYLSDVAGSLRRVEQERLYDHTREATDLVHATITGSVPAVEEESVPPPPRGRARKAALAVGLAAVVGVGVALLATPEPDAPPSASTQPSASAPRTADRGEQAAPEAEPVDVATQTPEAQTPRAEAEASAAAEGASDGENAAEGASDGDSGDETNVAPANARRSRTRRTPSRTRRTMRPVQRSNRMHGDLDLIPR
ncbi:MAG: serine/threonine-protein kinase [Myxococcota bacterium]